MGFWPVVQNVIKNSDIVLLVVDARMPELSRNSEIEKKIEYLNKKMIIVYNKIDLVPNKSIEELKKQFPKAFFVSGPKKIGIESLRRKILYEAKEMDLPDEPRIGIVGYPNVGKSSIINALAGRAKTKVSSTSGTTRGNQWINTGDLKIIDSPGVIPMDDKESKLGLISAKDPEKLKSPERVAIEILEFVTSKNKKVVEEYYKTKLSEDFYEAFLEIGKKRGFLGKGGIVDEHRTAVNIIMDWQRGKLRIK